MFRRFWLYLLLNRQKKLDRKAVRLFRKGKSEKAKRVQKRADDIEPMIRAHIQKIPR